MNGAGDRTRTGTVLLPGDFKSPVSTIPPRRHLLIVDNNYAHLYIAYTTVFFQHRNTKRLL